MARFEVLGRDTDRDLIRSIAKALAENSPEASALRATISQSTAGEPPRPRKPINAALLLALTSTMPPPQTQPAADLVRSMRDGDRH